ITTVGEVAAIDQILLVSILGRAAGRHLYALAHNQDPRPVRPHRRRRSIGAQRALGTRQRTAAEIAVVLLGLVERVAQRLRAGHRICRTVVLRMRFADYTRATRSCTLYEPTARTATLVKAAHALLYEALPVISQRGLTLIGIALTNLGDEGATQLALPFDRTPQLDRTLDSIRRRFGAAAVTRGSLVGRDLGPWVPLLPDPPPSVAGQRPPSAAGQRQPSAAGQRQPKSRGRAGKPTSRCQP
ncbi:MAG: DinB/UmuC family translesion DNA polymerase, partial [Solirubrobacteraceae bacterium]